jgi:hypothetical protein
MADTQLFDRIVGNRATETAAVLWVMELERKAGRDPIDRRFDSAFPADIESGGRFIEVKAASNNQRKSGFAWLEVSQFEEACRNANFYLYLVDNVAQGNPAEFRLRIFAGEQLARLLSRAKERKYFEVPIPVAEFDSAPDAAALRETPSHDSDPFQKWIGAIESDSPGWSRDHDRHIGEAELRASEDAGG